MKTLVVILILLQTVSTFSKRQIPLDTEKEVYQSVTDVSISSPHIFSTEASKGKPWILSMKLSGELYTINLNEIWELNGVVATAGLAHQYSTELRRWIPCGEARFAISTNSSSIQGHLDVNQERLHIFKNYYGVYKFLNEKQLHGVDDTNEMGTESIFPSLMRREYADTPTDQSSSWPSFSDLKATAMNGSACFSSRRIAPFGVVADYNFIQSFSTADAAQLHIIDTVNKASQVWEVSFNITLSLSEVIMGNPVYNYSWNIPCDTQENNMTSLQSRLTALSDWRKSKRPNDGLAFWSMFSNCPSSDVIGLAWQSTACQPGGVNIIHHSVLDYQILAHESGHVFGAVHDCVNTTCVGKSMSDNSMQAMTSEPVCCPYTSSQCDSNGRFIMSPGSEIYQQTFSRCTQGNICSAIFNNHINSSCLIEGASQYNGEYEPYCSAILDPAKYEKCWRDVQCWDVTNQSSDSSCGPLNSCSLHCLNKITKKCIKYDVPLVHEVSCKAGKSQTVVVPSWGWAIIGMSTFAIICAIVGFTIYCSLKKRYAKQERLSKYDMRIDVGPPQLNKKTITRDPLRGLPPILPYNIFKDPSESPVTRQSTSSFTSEDKDVFRDGQPLTRRGSTSSSSYSESDSYDLKKQRLDQNNY